MRLVAACENPQGALMGDLGVRSVVDCGERRGLIHRTVFGLGDSFRADQTPQGVQGPSLKTSR